ncbi:unnamed protein product [Oikopleura dioica]|uniref:Uncharacterized protein n=1 Tax=Oikopleura dioica TaxID=34765 RepID=E4YA31_OIKDI|nr:unnamed protein product [Oikopleura dioica]
MNIPVSAQIVVPLPTPQSGPPPPAPPVPPPPPPPASLPIVGSSLNGVLLENSVEDAAMDISLLLKRRFADCGESCEFHAAARAGDTRKMDNLATRDPSVINKKDSFGRSALWIVASVQLDWTVRTLNHLIKMKNIDLNSTDVRGQTPVFAAAKYNHISSLEILLENGADPNGSAESAESPLHVSVRDGMPEVASILLKYGASPDGERPGLEHRVNFGTIPIYTAIVYDQFQIFIELLKYGANPDLLMIQPGFTDSMLEGLLKHGSEVKWLKALFIAGMSPYQNVPDRPFYGSMHKHALLDEIASSKLQVRSLKSQARKIVRQNLPSTLLPSIPLKIPESVRRYLQLPELDKIAKTTRTPV